MKIQYWVWEDKKICDSNAFYETLRELTHDKKNIGFLNY